MTAGLIPQRRATPAVPPPTPARPATVMARSLAMTAAALERWLVPYWLVRAEGFRHRVAVPAQTRAAVLNALAGTGEPLRAEIFNGDRAVATVAVAELPTNGAAQRSSWLRIYQNLESGSARWRYGPRYGVDVEFWTLDGPILRGPRPTLLGDTIHTATPTASITIGPRAYPTFEPFTRRLPRDIEFPVDAVYMWVDGAGPNWRDRRTNALALLGVRPTGEGNHPARFRDRDELRYSLRSLDMFAPWLRNIFIVTDGQQPSWLDTDNPRVRIVDHREILTGRATLPTFNSAVIASGLHRIDGLAEHFLCFNDDVFLGSPVDPGLFFAASGASRFFPSPTPVPFGPVLDTEAHSMRAARNDRALLESAFGWTLTHAIKHTPHPVRRSVLAEVVERFDAAVRRTGANQFRDDSDITVVTLHHWYSMLTGRAIESRIRNSYVNTAAADAPARLDRLLTQRSSESICLNDTPHGPLDELTQASLVGAFLCDYFPTPAEAERADQPVVSGT